VADATCRFCVHPLDGQSSKFCTTCLPPYGEWSDKREYFRRYQWLQVAVGECAGRTATKLPPFHPALLRICQYRNCDNLSMFGKSGRPLKYCSALCKSREKYERRIDYGNVVRLADHLRYRDCKWCFASYKRHSDFCSDFCRYAAGRHIAVHRSPNSCALPVCIDCRLVFGGSPRSTGLWNDGNRCPACKSPAGRAKSRRARALRDGERVTVKKLMARDGHAPCHICTEPINYEDCNSEWGPSVDHLVPLSVGGPDVMDNAALAHRWCNSVRGVRDVDAIRHKLGVY